MSETAPIQDPSALTRNIETRYHALHREQLPLLAQLAEQVETVHLGDENVPLGLSDVLTHMIAEMEVHMKKEELILFPAVRRGGMPGIEQPITLMRADHDDHAAEVDEIRRLTGGPTLPKGACGTWTTLYTGLHAFLTDLEEHMRLENDVLSPQFEPQ